MDYTKSKNTYFATLKDDLKDRIELEVGDSKQSDFKPQVKLMRWDNEVNFSVRLKTEEIANHSKSGEKINWDGEKTNIEFYADETGEGGYKFVWYLKEKPVSNKIEFTIQSKGLDFFYQPELTPEEIAQGAFRPENVVGSYAVYHQTKGGMNDINGKEYKAGKAFHIFRPHIIDANGAETWGILHIENGIYSVEIPQDFLDKAVYPIKSNDTFGNTSTAGTENGFAGNFAHMVVGTPAGGNGTVSKLTMWAKKGTGNVNVKAVIWLVSDKSIIANGSQGRYQVLCANCNVIKRMEAGTHPRGRLVS